MATRYGFGLISIAPDIRRRAWGLEACSSYARLRGTPIAALHGEWRDAASCVSFAFAPCPVLTLGSMADRSIARLRLWPCGRTEEERQRVRWIRVGFKAFCTTCNAAGPTRIQPQL